MAIATTLKDYLEVRDIRYEIIDHRRFDSTLQTCESAHIPDDRMAKSVLPDDDECNLMAVIPTSHRLLLERVNELTGRRLGLIEEIELTQAFADCEPGALSAGPRVSRAWWISVGSNSPRPTSKPLIIPMVLHVTGEQFQRLTDEVVADEVSGPL
jgi:Ala-tRNA(Pro) deacylase